MEITFQPIGVIHSPFQNLVDMTIQPVGGASAPGMVEIYPEYSPGLKDLKGFSHSSTNAKEGDLS
jgi:tRNA (Thr-GGU) A37 N-methylase